MDKSFATDTQAKLAEYVTRTFRPEDPLLSEVRSRAEKAGLPPIHVGPMDGLHLEVLTRACGARKAVEIGTLAGYSGTHIARGLGPQGKLYTFEFEPKHAEVAQETFKRAGLSNQVEVFVGPALQNLSQIEAHGPFDLVFIDADKVSYPQYLKWAAKNLRVGGVVLGDNTFAWGHIADTRFDNPEDEASIRALQAFNQELATGGHFRSTILPTGEGLTLGVKIR